LIFGTGYWHYFSLTAHFFNDFATNLGIGLSDTFTILDWVLLLTSMLTYFGVWLIPATLPAVYEFRHSTSSRLSVMAVVTVWVSAVLGYYLNYVVMLAFVGLPNMEYLMLLGQRTATIWQDWANIFPKLILSKFLRWAVVGVIAGGVAGLITSSLYSALSKKNYKSLPT